MVEMVESLVIFSGVGIPKQAAAAAAATGYILR